MEFNKISPLEEYENDNKQSEIHTSNISTDSESSGPELNHGEVFFSEEDSSISSTDSSFIMEVDDSNLEEALKEIKTTSKKYNYIGMDTEYPGIVFSISSLTEDFYYKSLKLNVDSLKLIQLGITLSNENGEFPKPYHTWQFNFEFDHKKDKSSQSSLNLLMNSGIDFNKIKKCGINHKKFIEQFKNSGLVLNPNIHWISFHGSYDFAYLLSNLLSNSLPKTEKEFTDILGLFFPNHYDIRILVKNKEFLKGSLNKLANYLDVEREGKIHQAGSDSLVTIKVFWKLINSGIISKKKLIEDKNIIYGILKGKDNKETINYTKMNYGCNNNMNNTNKMNYIWNNTYNNMNYNHLPFGNNVYNICMNYCYPNIIGNGLYNSIGFNNVQMINNRNNFIQFC